MGLGGNMNDARDHDRGPDDGPESQPDEDRGSPGPYGLDAAVPGRTTPAPPAQSTQVTNRSSSVVVALLMPVALVVGFAFQLGASLQQTFGSGEPTPGTTLAVLLGVAIAVGIPAAVLVVEVRERRKDRSRSSAAMIAAIVVLCIAGALDDHRRVRVANRPCEVGVFAWTQETGLAWLGESCRERLRHELLV